MRERSLGELLEACAREAPTRRAYSFVSGSDESTLTRGELHDAARATAMLLQESGVRPGDRVLLLYPPGLDYIVAFFGCLFAGAIAVPAYPPDPLRLARTLPRIRAIVADAQPAAALTIPAVASMMDMVFELAPELGALSWLAPSGTAPPDSAWSPYTPAPDDVAFLQYTSGSTGTPKGVMLTHANLLNNLVSIHGAFALDESASAVIWLPPYHDMGLIGGILEPLYAGFAVVLISPLEFLRRPLTWLELMSRARATVSGGPNFAYDLCVRKTTPEQRLTLDLSQWRLAFTGAEPVRAETIERFVKAFEPSGFRREAFYPCYGLAESTLIVSGGLKAEPPVVRFFSQHQLGTGEAIEVPADSPGAQSLVGCGRPLPGTEIAIVDSESGTRSPAGHVGEIWVSSGSVGKGYWRRPDDTARVFHAQTTTSGDPQFLRTGDLGFVHGGELFVTGRVNDLIIIRGRNYYPQDIELTVEQSHPALRPGCGAAVAMEMDGQERLVIIYELERRHVPDRRRGPDGAPDDKRGRDRRTDDPEVQVFAQTPSPEVLAAPRPSSRPPPPDPSDVFASIREQIIEHHQLRVDTIVLIKAATIPKTSSGKIQRHACASRYLSGELEVLGVWNASDRRSERVSVPPTSAETDLRDVRPEPLGELPGMLAAPVARATRARASIEQWIVRRVERLTGVSGNEITRDRPLVRYGLDSIGIVDLCNAVAHDLGLEVSPESILRGASIADLAREIDETAVSPTNSAPTIPRIDDRHAAPASFVQQRFWLIDQLEPGSVAYNLHAAVRVVGALDEAALRASIRFAFERHEVLRTVFRADGDALLQHVVALDGEPVAVVDASAGSPNERADAIARASAVEAQRPFDLAKGPLARLTLLRVEPQLHVLLLTIHHAVFDGWSARPFASDVAAAYAAFARGAAPDLPPLPVRYRDFAAWQREQIATPAAAADLEYWQQQLAGAPRILDLPTDRPRPPRQTYGGATLATRLAPALTEALRTVARTDRATAFVAMFATWALVLHRTSAQTDIVIGVPAANRAHASLGGVVGPFVDMLPLRVQIEPSTTFRSLLVQARDATIDAIVHNRVPFEKLLEVVSPERSAQYSPLFQVTLNPLDAIDMRLELAGLATDVAITLPGSRFDMTLYLRERDGGVVLELAYNTDLFDRARAVETLEQIMFLLEQVTAAPERPVAQYSLVTPSARALLPSGVAALAAQREDLPHAAVGPHAARSPSAVALIDRHGAWTYAQLASRSNQLAHLLRARGVQSQDVVAIYAAREASLVWALLGVLKAGAAFVVLDSAYPAAQLAARVRAAAPRAFVVLDGAGPLPVELDALASASDVACVVRLPSRADDADATEPWARQPSTPPAVAIEPEHVAYVAFTSGSTGAPKGIVGTHAPVGHFLRWHVETFGLQSTDRFSMLSGLAHDPLLRDVFTALRLGATLCIPDPERFGSPDYLAQWLREQRITVAHMTPSIARLVTEGARDDAPLPALRRVFLGGEALAARHVRSLRRIAPDARLVNFYGATETPQAIAYFVLPENESEIDAVLARGVTPIGRGIRDVELLVLNRAGQLAGVGELGEIHVRTPYLARGYLAQPEAQLEDRFAVNPLTGLAGDRVYRTGDLGRYLPGGDVALAGRADDQVKVRGFRVEPGDVEQALARVPGLRAAAVAAYEDADGEQALVAYVVPTDDYEPDLEAPRDALARMLPWYMQPSAYVWLAGLPLTPNGKVDRRALPAVDRAMPGHGGGGGAPRDATERAIAAIWCEVLRVRDVGLEHDFFALGGQSLLATQVLARVGRVLGVALPLRALFDSPTLGAFASRVAAAERENRRPELPRIVPVPRDGPLPLSFAQERQWYLEQLEPSSATYNMTAAVRLTGPLDRVVLERALAEIVRRHESLRTTVHFEDGRAVQRIDVAGSVKLDVVDVAAQGGDAGEAAVVLLAREIASQPFDLATGPLLRVTLFRLGDDDHVLQSTMHHLISDGWSMSVFVREASLLYRAFIAGEASPLAPLPVQYADFAVWQRGWIAGPMLDSLVGYWKRALAGAPAAIELPTDRPRKAIHGSSGARHSFEIAPRLVATIEAVARRHGATPFMLLLAGFATLMSRYSGQRDVVVGSPVANRRGVELETLIGFFVNTLALRVDLSGDPDAAELFRRVRDTTLDAQRYQDLPFEKLVEALRPPRTLARTPVFQVAFALQNAPPAVIDVPGLSTSTVDVAPAATKFEFTLVLTPRDGGLAGTVEYSTDLFEPATVARMASQYLLLLTGMARAPSTLVTRLEILDEAERRRVLYEWNTTSGPFPSGARLHTLFEARAAAAPDALAVLDADVRLTYGELDRRANRLAHHLRGLGCRRGALVGLWVERSADAIVGMLGVLKAGGAYVPLDPAWPRERVAGILASLGVGCVLVQAATLSQMYPLLFELDAMHDIVCLDVDAETPPAEALDASVIRGLFDRVASMARDRAAAGGFVHDDTGAAFSDAEVEVYRDHVGDLARASLRPDGARRVLEIGCGSGEITFALARELARYVALDPSEVTQARNRETARAQGLTQVEFRTGFAHEVDALLGSDTFDLIVVASTIQFFPGPVYLARVLEQLTNRLAPGGALVIADVLDPALEPSTGARTAGTLRVAPTFFRGLGAQLARVSDVDVRRRDPSRFANELGRRYDVVLRARREDEAPVAAPTRAVRRVTTRAHLAARPDGRPSSVGTPNDIAYVIFTSGSTGRPKGVFVRHAPAVNLVDWVNTTFAVGPDDRILFLTSLCFDLSVYDVFGLLAAGGSIRVATRADLRDPALLVAALCRDGITFWDSAPAALQQLAPVFPPARTPSSLRLVFLSGDWIPVALPDRVRAAFPGAQVVSLGGATEATVWSNVYPVDRVDPAWRSIPYGRPIRNAHYHVLDAQLAPCPVGVSGDLYIGGLCLAEGYLGDPALTATKFVPDPFATTPGVRLYRTGDCARYLGDGNLEFLGRRDTQVKIRGYRVELGEIETVLARHAAIASVAVAIHEYGPDDRRLVAYVVARAGATAQPDELRDHLRGTLPPYMVPAAFVVLDALPTTSNGKLDRSALPAPDAARQSGEVFVAAGTDAERTIAAIWSETLRLDHVGALDNFFDLGGHSLLLAQVHARIRDSLAPDLTLNEMFQYPTVRALAARVTEGRVATTTARDNDAQRRMQQQRAATGRYREQALARKSRKPG